jgi:hypothetical protein
VILHLALNRQCTHGTRLRTKSRPVVTNAFLSSGRATPISDFWRSGICTVKRECRHSYLGRRPSGNSIETSDSWRCLLAFSPVKAKQIRGFTDDLPRHGVVMRTLRYRWYRRPVLGFCRLENLCSIYCIVDTEIVSLLQVSLKICKKSRQNC